MKKIMFNDKYGLAEAVLSGRKTHTRRIIPKSFFSLNWDVREDEGTLVVENDFGDFIDIRHSRFAKYKVGEVVAMAQKYEDIFDKSNCVNPCDWDDEMPKQSGWNNKMFVRADLMPHQICITDVKVERLQDISDEDCIKEGIQYIQEIGLYYFERRNNNEGFYFGTPLESYAALIDKVSGKETWKSNPFVFAYEFKLIK